MIYPKGVILNGYYKDRYSTTKKRTPNKNQQNSKPRIEPRSKLTTF